MKSDRPSTAADPRTPGSGRRAVALASAVLVLGALAGCSLSPAAPTRSRSTAPTVHVPKVPSTPHYDALKVGSKPYVNACRAYLLGDDTNVVSAFAATQPIGAVVQETYAENPLPAAWYASGENAATSTCSLELADGPWEGAFSVGFSVVTYASASLAAKAFREYKITTQADVDRYNATHDPDITLTDSNYSAVAGLAKTSFQKSSGASYTLAGNTIIEFNLGSQVDEAVEQDAVRRAVPRAVASVERRDQAAAYESIDFGKKIGESTYRNPCSIFTSAAFQKASGLTPDPTSIDLTFNSKAVTDPRDPGPEGRAKAECSRRALKGQPGGSARFGVEVRFFTSAEEAAQQFAADPARSDSRSTPVAGMGENAFLYDGKFLHVVRGPYEIEVSGSTAKPGKLSADASLDLLKAAATATAAQLG